MPLRPIDMQILLPKVPEVSKTQQIQNNHEQTQAQQFASEMNKQARHAENQVQTTEEAESKSIARDKGKSASGQDHASHDNQKDQEEPQEEVLPSEPNKGTHLDIKV